jgi:hypothetical protein
MKAFIYYNGADIKLIQVYNLFSCRILYKGQLTTPFETKSGDRDACSLHCCSWWYWKKSWMVKLEAYFGKLQKHLRTSDYAENMSLLSYSQAHMQRKSQEMLG